MTFLKLHSPNLVAYSPFLMVAQSTFTLYWIALTPARKPPGGVLRISSDGDDRMEPNVKTQNNPWTKN